MFKFPCPECDEGIIELSEEPQPNIEYPYECKNCGRKSIMKQIPRAMSFKEVIKSMKNECGRSK